MSFKVEIPYGAYWSTPFARWQGSFANLHSIEFAAHVARLELARRKIDPASFDYGVLGFSVPQKHSFYGLPWLTGLIGAGQAGGPTLMQACATGVRTLLAAAQEIEARHGLGGAGDQLRPHLERPPSLLSEPARPGWHGVGRRLGHGQLQLRPARWPRHAADRRERRQETWHRYAPSSMNWCCAAKSNTACRSRTTPPSSSAS
jgi:hypothetical protein